MGAYSVAVCDQWRCKEAEVGEKQSWRGPQWGPGTKPPEAEKHDMNFALRITLVDAHRPFYSSYKTIIITTFVIGFLKCCQPHNV